MKPLVNRDILATCWTLAGDATPRRGEHVSPVAIARRIEAVAAGGWQGVGFVHADLARFDQEMGLTELSVMLDANGVTIVEVEFITDCWTDGPAKRESDRVRDELFAAANLGARGGYCRRGKVQRASLVRRRNCSRSVAPEMPRFSPDHPYEHLVRAASRGASGRAKRTLINMRRRRCGHAMPMTSTTSPSIAPATSQDINGGRIRYWQVGCQVPQKLPNSSSPRDRDVRFETEVSYWRWKSALRWNGA